MIYDTLDSMEKYKGIYPSLDRAIAYIASHKISDLPDGRTEIDEDIYVNVIHGKLIASEEGQYEFHRSYLDIHIDIDGEERIQIADKAALAISQDYEAEGDYALGTGKAIAECLVDDSHFCICMLDEPHMPCVKADYSGDGEVRKAIFKIKV